MKIIVSDGVFSQDGDIVPLPDMLALAEQHDACYIDDAHATGVLGPARWHDRSFQRDSDRLICMARSAGLRRDRRIHRHRHELAQIIRLSCSPTVHLTLPPDQAYAVCEAMDAVLDERSAASGCGKTALLVAEIDKLALPLISRQTASCRCSARKIAASRCRRNCSTAGSRRFGHLPGRPRGQGGCGSS